VKASDYNFPSRKEVRPQELKMAEQLIGNLAEPFDPERYTDDYRSNLMKIIRAKMKGKTPKLPEQKETPETGVLDLMSKLRASLDQGSTRKTAAKKSARTKRATSSRSSKRKTA
jgi:DNA end-binding protein Ku